MSDRTKFLGRFLGLYCLLVSLIMAWQKQAMVQIENTLVQNEAMLYLGGILTMAGGLAIVIGHNRWSGGALPVTVTLLGWLMLIKGLLLAMPGGTAGLWGYFAYERLYYLYVAIAFALGAWLTYAGFRQPPTDRDRRERPRVAA
jgi:hypothetical protein